MPVTHPYPVWQHLANDTFFAASEGQEGEFESLPVQRITDTTGMICCIPCFLYRVALGDVVEVTGRIAGQVVQPGGRRVFRVLIDEDDYVARSAIREMLEMANGLSEWGSARLLAIDAPTTRLAAQYEEHA